MSLKNKCNTLGLTPSKQLPIKYINLSHNSQYRFSIYLCKKLLHISFYNLNY